MENISNQSTPVKPPLQHRRRHAFGDRRKGLSRPFNHLPAWLKNKYFISFTAFFAVILFLDKNDLLTQLERRRELRELRQSKQYYTTQIAAERKELEALKNSPATLEKYAREKYLMKRDDEEIFIVPEKPANSKN